MDGKGGNARLSRPGSIRQVLLLAGLTLLVVFPTTLFSGDGARSSPLGPARLVPDRQYPSTCPFHATDTGSSRDVPLAPPGFPLSARDSLTVSYEFAIHNVSHRAASLRLTVPSFTAMFPLTSGSTFEAFLPPRALWLNGTAWSSSSLASKTKVAGGVTSFAKTPATMTSQLVAIMANASYQTATIVFRWDWAVTFATNGTTISSPWSRVATNGTQSGPFYPAPYVGLVSTSSTSPEIGSKFTAFLSGATSNTNFRSVLEYASTGREIRNDETITGPGNATSAGVSVLILPYQSSLAPSTLLDHVRDYCLSLLYSISLHVVYAPSANVTLSVWPPRCGPVVFNGTAFRNGGTIRVTPSSSGVSIGAPSCSGWLFHGWSRSAGVWVGSPGLASTNATISASGNLTASYS